LSRGWLIGLYQYRDFVVSRVPGDLRGGHASLVGHGSVGPTFEQQSDNAFMTTFGGSH
jgi:hypothetical protein